MDIEDKILLEQVLNNEDKLFLHKDTIKILNSINELVKNDHDNTFAKKEVTKLIIKAWTYILQDSINNLKCCDFREYSHLSRKQDHKDLERDINNEFTFGLDRINKYFREFTEFESILYGVDTGYRDHVIHVFRVWLLGLAILHSNEDGLEIRIQDIIFEPIIPGKCVINDEEVSSMWAIIALCHDLGYPLEKAEKINDSVEKMYRHLGKMNIQKFSASFQLEHQYLNKFLLDFISSKIVYNECKFTRELSEAYDAFIVANKIAPKHKTKFIDRKHFHTTIQAKYYIKFAKSLEYYSHGIISCSILLKSLFFFLESDFNVQEKTTFSFEDARQFFIRREILRSIAAHTCPEVYHLKANTLSFLLILCDELQEWDRPRFKEMRGGGFLGGINKLSISKFNQVEIAFSAEYMGVIDPEAFAKKTFQRWHAILRSAVYDEDRKFSLKFSLKINGKDYDFCYEGNSLKAEYRPVNDTETFKIYELLPEENN